jgi:hypothetical protein
MNWNGRTFNSIRLVAVDHCRGILGGKLANCNDVPGIETWPKTVGIEAIVKAKKGRESTGYTGCI